MVALFGDGDLTPKDQVLRKVAQMKSENIRFVTRGLGAAAAQEFGEISDEEPSSAAIDDVGGPGRRHRRHGRQPQAPRPNQVT